MLITRFRGFFFWLWVNHFWLYYMNLMLAYYSVHLSILGHISAACSYWKLEFCATSFWFYHHRLWWSSWHTMLELFLLYKFMVWIFSWCDLFQVTETDTTCVLYVICFQFITFETIMLYAVYCAWFVILLALPYAVLLHTCPYLFLAQFDSSVYIIIQFELQWSVQS